MKTESMHWINSFDSRQHTNIQWRRDFAASSAPVSLETYIIAKMAWMLDDAEARLVKLGADPPSAAIFDTFQSAKES